MSKVRALKIPAAKVMTVALGKKEPFVFSDSDSPQEIFIPNEDWHRWADLIQQHPNDCEFFLAAAHAPYMFVRLNLPLDEIADLSAPGELPRMFPNDGEWPQGWDERFAVFIVDSETVANWLVDNPIED